MANKFKNLRKDFPILNTKVGKYDLVYLDNSATTHKPQAVIDRVSKYYSEENANTHRGVHHLGKLSTKAFEDARKVVAQFINAKSENEIIFTSGTTLSINTIANSLVGDYIQSGDEVLITEMEHHANIVPWQLLSEKFGIVLKYVPVDQNGNLQYELFEQLITNKTKLISFVAVSNSLGIVNDIEHIISIAKAKSIRTLIDATQLIQHFKTDVQKIDCDYLVFSAHKIYAPMGLGVLYGREYLLDEMKPFLGGGDMIKKVSLTNRTTYNQPPYKFEAGTPNAASVVGLHTALEYIGNIGFEDIVQYENYLAEYLYEKLKNVTNINILGESKHRIPTFSFIFDNVHSNDIASLLDTKGIAVRSGHHCTQPLLEKLGHSSTTRVSCSFYNTLDEIDYFVDNLNKVITILS